VATLLHIQASPRGERSYSVRTAEAFIKAYHAKNPGDEVVTIDLSRRALPAFDGHTLQAKYAILGGKEHTADEAAAWRAVEDAIAEFKSADKYVVSVPMWNFGVPYKLKHYLDVIIQPGYTFAYSPETGYTGLVTGKPAVLICARGGQYPEGSESAGLDFQKPYMKTVLGFIGITDVREVVVEGTLFGPDVATASLEAGLATARELAKEF